MIERLTEILGNRPQTGAGISFGSFFGGIFLNATPTAMTMITDILQIVAFAVSIAVGIMTMISINKKNRKP